MADQTKIEWTDATANVINGCSLASPGCTHCYAMRLAGTRMKNHPTRAGLTQDTKAGPVWTGEVRFNEKDLLRVLAWRKPRMIFWCAHGDMFHPNVPDAWIDRCFAVMALTPHHTHQVLTKRSARMREYVRDRGWEGVPVHEIMAAMDGSRAKWPDLCWPLPNVWLGVSVEDQTRADERIPDLLATPAAVRWISAEPLLGPVDLESAWHGENALDSECWGECGWCPNGHPPLHNCQQGRQSDAVADKGRSGLDWVVAGGESGPGARPMHPDWARSLRDQCAAAGVPFLFKQWGEWAEVGHDEDGPKVTEVRTQRGRDMHSARAQGPIGFISPTGNFFRTEHEIRGRARLMHRVGKSAAGRTLDGQLHDGYPA